MTVIEIDVLVLFQNITFYYKQILTFTVTDVSSVSFKTQNEPVVENHEFKFQTTFKMK